jgi:hypothetical protein
MRIIELLNSIRDNWLDRTSRLLVRGEGVRESFLGQLNQFFDLIIQAVLTGDPAWLDSILDAWAESRTQSELEKQETSLGPMLNQILLATFDVASEELSGEDALMLMGAILPLFTYAFQHTTELESRLHIEHISSELNKVRFHCCCST